MAYYSFPKKKIKILKPVKLKQQDVSSEVLVTTILLINDVKCNFTCHQGAWSLYYLALPRDLHLFVHVKLHFTSIIAVTLHFRRDNDPFALISQISKS